VKIKHRRFPRSTSNTEILAKIREQLQSFNRGPEEFQYDFHDAWDRVLAAVWYSEYESALQERRPMWDYTNSVSREQFS
jgi:hypothetical protein